MSENTEQAAPAAKPDVLVMPARHSAWFSGFVRHAYGRRNDPPFLIYDTACVRLVPSLGSAWAGNGAAFMPRALAEQDPRWKQLIGYCMVLDGAGRILTYYRPQHNTEVRLRGQRSLGFGGHTEPCDVAPYNPSAAAAVRLAVQRELREELGLPTDDSMEFIGCLNHDDTSVGSVHLGLVFSAQTKPDQVLTYSDEITGPEWLTIDEAYAQLGEFEVWSQMLLRYLKGSQV